MVREMFEDEALDQRTVGFLMLLAAQPSSARKWGIINYVAGFDEGTWLDGPEVDGLTGVTWGRRDLTEFVKAKVLDCDDGGGGNQRWYRVNPQWWRWKAIAVDAGRRGGRPRFAGVLWAHRCEAHKASPPSSLAACGACRRAIEERLAEHLHKAQQHPVDLFISRAGRAFARVNARLSRVFADDPVVKKALEAQNARRSREMGKSGGHPDAISRAGRAFLTNNARPARDFSPGLEEEEISTSGTDSSPPTELDPGDYGRARKALFTIAIAGRGRRKPGLWGHYRTRVQALVAEHGVEAFEAGCRLLEARAHPVPVLVDQLADLLASGLDLETATEAELEAQASRLGIGAGEWHPSTAMLRLQTVRDLIATYEADTNSAGESVPAPPELLAERDALVAQLYTEEAACAG